MEPRRSRRTALLGGVAVLTCHRLESRPSNGRRSRIRCQVGEGLPDIQLRLARTDEQVARFVSGWHVDTQRRTVG